MTIQPWIKLPQLPDYEDTFLIYIVMPGRKKPIRYIAEFIVWDNGAGGVFRDLLTHQTLDPISWTLCPQVA